MNSYQESFIRYLKYEKRFSSHTVVAYSKDLDQFVNYCTDTKGAFDVHEVDSKLFRGWIVSLMEEKLSPRSVNRKASTIKAFYRFLMKGQVLQANPANNVTLPKIRKKLPHFLEENQLHHLLDDGYFDDSFSSRRDKLIIALLYGTGIRLSELLNLKDSDFESGNRQIRVLGKRNKERIIPYPGEISELYNLYREVRDREIEHDHKYLFVTSKGDQVYAKLVYRIVTGYLSRVTSQERKSPHVLRHTYATHLLNKGADLNAVKELLGHSNLAATEVYTHTTFERLHDIYKQAHPRG